MRRLLDVWIAYTDENGTGRTLTLAFKQLTGATPINNLTNTTGAGPYLGIPQHIRCDAASTITVSTTGTFTAVTYNVEAILTRIS